MMDSTTQDHPPCARDQFREGCRLLEAGQTAEAVEQLIRAAWNAPRDREILAALAAALERDGQIKAALRTYNQLIALGEMTAENWCAIGHVLVRVGEYAQAITAYEQSIALLPEYAEAHHHLGQACFKMGAIDRAVDHLQIAADRSGRLVSLMALATLIPGAPSADLASILAVRKRFASCLAQSVPPAPITNQAPSSPDRKIRVGYLSGFFFSANYMKPVWALINHHDRSRFEIHLLSDSPQLGAMEGYLAHAADQVHDVSGLCNADLAARIAELNIDILVDLNAYSKPERLGLFLTPPAPVCVAWFNMYATSGLPGFHYIVGDDAVVSEDEDPYYSETVVRLPASYLTFNVNHRVPPVAEPPCLSQHQVTFGCLAAQYKITPKVIAAFAEILKRSGNAGLLIANRAMDASENRAWVQRCFGELGISPDRIQLLGSASHYEYLQYYDRIDIALDTFPYNGGTTTMEAIWQGVPVLTFNGDRWASRTSQSLLLRTHLADFVCQTETEMIEAAARLAVDDTLPQRLLKLRRTMRARLESSAACDGVAFAKHMEAFFQSVYRPVTV